jgi:shikimate kinase
MKKSRNIYLVGPLGAGKSTIGRYLADELKMDFFDTDTVIEERCGAEISWIFDVEGEAGFRKREEKVVHDLTEKTGIVLATGGGVVESGANRARLSARGTVVYLKVDLEHQLDRTMKDKKRPLLQQGDKREVLQELNSRREPLYKEVAEFEVTTGDRSVRTVANEIIQMVTADDL